jgi:outer membrane biosynthesis protein TonB
MLRAKYNLNGHASLKGATNMRVFCPEHKKGFFAPRQNPIKCENRGHLLGEIDFEGQAASPVDLQWQYCCNCEHFCSVDFDQYGLQCCPVCTRRSSLLYLCDRCYVISFESNTPLQTKNFTLTAEGVPQPSCPGCLRPAATDLHEHTCDVVNTSFITGLNACPICEERLDIAPAFPSLVASYLKRTKAANKVNVTFDYETGVFVPVEDGEFVVVTNTDQPVVMPRATKFSAKRDFYEFYQDYYHCPNPDAGDVQIIQPAFVSRAANGWNLVATGILDVVKEQPKKKAATPVPQPPPPQPPLPPPVAKRQEPPPEPVIAAKKSEPPLRTCAECGSQIEDKYAFCWKCGHSMQNESKPRQIFSSALDLDDEPTMQHEPRPLNSTVLPWTAPRPQEHPSSSSGSVLKLLAIGGISFMLLSLGVFGLFRTETHTAAAPPAPVSQPASQPQPQPAVPAITTEVSRNAPAETTTQQVAANPEDELKKLRERRMTAPASERPKVFQAFATVEKQYPRDYRFPYERAKFAAKGSRSGSQSEAFKALTTAAQKAITTGKANEMLTGLETDKSGDFSRLSQGRFEWSRLVAALKRKDTSLLSE